VIVPTIGMNAFAFSDLNGHACIGMTEGCLARLSRRQLEGVVAHEMAHVLSGSYVTVTVACLLFGLYSSWLEGLSSVNMSGAFDQAPGSGGASAAGGGIVMLGVFFLSVVISIVELASTIVNAAISRSREFEADMAAVRYTRDPVSLAQALQAIDRRSGGAGYVPSGLAPLCIRPTGSEGGGIFSTHPSTRQRVAVLLRVANMGIADFANQSEEVDERAGSREHVTLLPQTQLSVTQMEALLVPGVIAGGKSGADPLSLRTGDGTQECPTCEVALTPTRYEGLTILACRSCGGRLTRDNEMGRIIARREMGFTDAQERLADQVTAEGNERRKTANRKRGQIPANLIACPLCQRTMFRRFYSYAYAVEVDACTVCGATWFDKDELEVLQILVERQTP